MQKIKYVAGFLFISLIFFGGGYIESPSGFANARKLGNHLGFTNKYLCVFAPNESHDFGDLDLERLKGWNSSLRYVVGAQHLSVIESTEEGVLRQRYVPSNEGTQRVVGVFAVQKRSTYELKQSVLFEESFDWGGSVQSGKFGFGLGGGSAPTGGTTDKDGFTARLAWRGNGDGTASATLYLYSSDRSMNLPYGDEIEIPNFTLPTGKWFDVALRLTVNSDHSLADGKISVHINNKLMLERSGIQWQAAGEKVAIDRLLFSSFHGGNSTAWSPGGIVYAQFSNACLYD